MLPISLRLEYVLAVGANERQRFSDLCAISKDASADFAQERTPAPGVVVDVLMWGIAPKTHRGLRDGILAAPLDWADWLAILPTIIFLQKLPVLLLKLTNNWEPVGFELLICRRVKVIKRKLPEWDVSRNEANE